MLRAWATISKNRATATSEKQVPNVTFDTNVFITRKPAYFPAGLVLSAVVMQEFGRTPKLPDGDKHRIISDVLIAITARRAQATIITDNLKNFQ